MSQRSGFGSAISRRNSLDVSHLSSVNSKSFGAKTVGKSSRRKTFNAIPDLEEGSFLTEDSSFISSTNDENDESMFNASNCNTSEHSIPSRPSTGGGSKRRWSHRSTDQSPMSLKSPMQLRSAEKSKVASDAKSVSSRNSVRSSNSNSTKASKKDSAESTSATKSDHGSLSSVRSKLSNARSMASGADNRRQTFDGGQQALNMLLDTSDSTDLGAAALAAARESRSRRATVDPSDLDEMMKELEDDSDSMRLSVSSGVITRSSVSSSNKSNISKSPYTKSPLLKKSRASTTPLALEKIPSSDAASSADAASPFAATADEGELAAATASSSPNTPSAPKSAPTSQRRSPRFVKAMNSLSRSSSGASLASFRNSEDASTCSFDDRDHDDDDNAAPRDNRRTTVDAADLQAMLGDLSADQLSVESSAVQSKSMADGSSAAQGRSINSSTCSDLSFLSSSSATTGSMPPHAQQQQQQQHEGEEEVPTQLDEPGSCSASISCDLFVDDNDEDVDVLLLRGADTRRETADPDVMKMLLDDVAAAAASANKSRATAASGEKSVATASSSPDNDTVCAANISFGSSNDYENSARRESIDLQTLLRVSASLNEGNGNGLTPTSTTSKTSVSRSSIHSYRTRSSTGSKASAGNKFHSTASPAAAASAADRDDTDDFTADGNATVDAAERDALLDDTIATEQSSCTIGTEILDIVQANLEAEELRRAGEEDDDDELTTGSIAGLADLLAQIVDDSSVSATAAIEATSENAAVATAVATNAEATDSAMKSPRRSSRLSVGSSSPAVHYCATGPSPRKCLICDNSEMFPVRHSPASRRKSPRKSPYRSPNAFKSSDRSYCGFTSPKVLDYNDNTPAPAAVDDDDEADETGDAEVDKENQGPEALDMSVQSITDAAAAVDTSATSVPAAAPDAADADAAAMPPPAGLPSALKSCLSQRKSNYRTRLAASMEKAARPRNVVFGSPQAAEFNRSSPTTSFTPLDKAKTNSLFSMSAPEARNMHENAAAVDPVTQENDRIMNEWERLTNASEGGSDDEMDDPHHSHRVGNDDDDEDDYFIDIEAEQGDPSFASPAASKSSLSLSRRPVKSSERRRRSMLQPVIDAEPSPSPSRASSSSMVSSGSEGSSVPPGIDAQDYDRSFDGSQSSYSQESSGLMLSAAKETSSYAMHASDSSIISDATNTVSLAANLLEVVEQNYQQLQAAAGVAELPTQIDEEVANTSSNSQSSEADHTEEIETDLHTLMQNIAPHSGGKDGRSVSESSNDEADEGCSSLVDIAYRRQSFDSRSNSSSSSKSEDSGDRTMSILEDPQHVASLMDRDSPSALGGLLGNATSFESSAIDQRDASATAGDDEAMETSEDVTYALEGSLAALVNNIGSPEAAPATAASPAEQQRIEDADALEAIAPTAPEHVKASYDGEVDTSVAMDVVEDVDDADGEEDDNELASPDAQQLSCIATAPSESGSPWNESGDDSTCDFSVAPHDTSILEQQQSVLLEVADMADSICDSSDVVHVPLADTSGLMDRIKKLNAGARSNTLHQLAVPNERMSLGMNRLSMGLSATAQKGDGSSTRRQSKRRSGATARLQSALAAAGSIAAPAQEDDLRPSTRRMSKRRTSSLPADGDSTADDSVLLDRSTLSGVDTITKAYGLDKLNHSRVSFMDNPLIDEADKENASLNSSVVSGSLAEDPVQRMQVQVQLFEFFNLLQSIKTIISTKAEETQSKVQLAIMANIRAAYVDSVIALLPPASLLPIWTMGAAQADEFVTRTMKQQADVIAIAPVAVRDAQATSPEQLLLNMTAVTIHGIAAQNPAPDARGDRRLSAGNDRFFSKVLAQQALPEQQQQQHDAPAGSALINAVAQAEQRLQELRLELDVVNKLTYCRITAFKSSCIRVNAVLSPAVSASVVFHIHKAQGAAAGGKPVLKLENTEVDLVVADAAGASAAQQAAVSAYFASVMAADSLEGPLSSASLLQVETPSQIPDLLHKINGSIAALRLTLELLKNSESRGWSFSFAMTHESATDAVLSIRSPRGEQRSMPYRHFVSSATTASELSTTTLQQLFDAVVVA